MKKNYSNRQFTPNEQSEIAFFFPKHAPPVTIYARTREEAEGKLAELDNHKEHE